MIENADHMYTGEEAQVARTIAEWADSLEPRSQAGRRSASRYRQGPSGWPSLGRGAPPGRSGATGSACAVSGEGGERRHVGVEGRASGARCLLACPAALDTGQPLSI